MFEITFTLSPKCFGQIKEELAKLKERLYAFGAGYSESKKAFTINCLLKQKEVVAREIKSFLVEVYCKAFKSNYFISTISALRGIGEEHKKLLLETLIVFDRERDEELVLEKLTLLREFSLDGFFTFRLKELKERWNDALKMVCENLYLLQSESAFYLFLRFLLSTAIPKSECVRIAEKDNGYIMKVGFVSASDTCVLSSCELLSRLIDIAPMEIVVEGRASGGEFIRKLKGLFDVKKANNTLKFGENLC